MNDSSLRMTGLMGGLDGGPLEMQFSQELRTSALLSSTSGRDMTIFFASTMDWRHFSRPSLTWIYTGLALLLGYSLFKVFIRPHISSLRHLPSPNQGLALFRLLHEPNANELEAWLDTVPHNGLIRYFGLWNEERLFASSPEAVRDLLVKQPYHYVKPRLQFLLAKNISDEGLLIQEGHVHKVARKGFGPAMNPERLHKAYPVMWDVANQLVKEIDHQTTQDLARKPAGQASILRPISAAAIDIVGHVGYSRAFNALAAPSNAFAKAYIGMFKTTKRGQMTLDAAAKIGPDLALALPLRAVKTIKSIMALVHRTSQEIVHEHEEAFAQGREHEKDDMLSAMMKTNQFSSEDLVVQTTHLLAAATETVSGSMAWAIHILSRHPEIQSRLREEMAQSLSSSSGVSIESDINRMPYLHAVIKEVLRFHSINTILWRECASAEATICGLHIPIGTKVVFSPWASNRDPAIWGADARTFNPDRWLGSSTAPTSKHAFLTFGAGARRCMGEPYAMAQMQCVIVALVRNFEWTECLPRGKVGSDEGEEIGDFHALLLFKIFEGWNVGCRRLTIS